MLLDENLMQFIIKEREKALKEWEDKVQHQSRMESYWIGYLDALNAVLAEANKVPIVLCENLGMGFD